MSSAERDRDLAPSRKSHGVSDVEKRVAALEGRVAALALSSGRAASALAIQNLARVGDNVVSSTDLYGGAWNLFANTLEDQGIEVASSIPPTRKISGKRRTRALAPSTPAAE